MKSCLGSVLGSQSGEKIGKNMEYQNLVDGWLVDLLAQIAQVFPS